MNKTIVRVLVAVLVLVMLVGIVPLATLAGAVSTTENMGWVKVTDAATLKAGDKLLLGAADGSAVATDFPEGKTFLGVAAGQLPSAPEGALELTLGGQAGAWTLANAEGKLLNVTGKSNNKLSWNGDNTAWTIEIDAEGNATITNTWEDGRPEILLYNPSNTRFANYKAVSSSCVLPALYRYEEVTTGEDTKPSFPAADSVLTIAQANEIAALAGSDYTADKYYITGKLTEIAHATYGNCYIEDEQGNRLYIYGMYSADGTVRFDAMDPQPSVGDTITIYTALGAYNEAPQAKNAWVTKLVPSEAKPVECTVAEALAAENSTLLTVSGEITFKNGKSIYIQDATGAIGVYLKNADTAAEWKIGDKLTATGTRGSYNGLNQINLADDANAVCTAGTATVTPIKGGAEIIKDENLCHLITLEGAYEVVEIQENSSIVIKTGAEETMLIYKAPIVDGLKVGDTITSVNGVLSIYKTPQILVDEVSDIQFKAGSGEPTPSEPTPSEPTPSEPTPSEPVPSEPAPSEPAPSQPAPTQPTAPAEPVNPTNPDSGDNMLLVLMVGMVCVLAMAAVVIVRKKNI